MSIGPRCYSFKCVFAVILASIVVGCATAPPVQEMSDARQAIAAAKDAGAQRFAVAQLGQAEAFLNKAEKFLEAGGSAAYWQARQAAISAKEVAFEALLASRNARDPGTAGTTE